MRVSRMMWIAGFVSGVCWSLNAGAGVVLSPTSVVNNTLGTFNLLPASAIDRTHDGSGLLAFASGATDFGAYIGANPSHALFDSNNAWASAAGVFSGVIDYDLGSSYSIFQIALWNQGSSQAIDSFEVFTADNAAFVGATSVGSFNSVEASTAAEVFGLSSSVGRYVRLQINSNRGASCCTSLGEVAFDVDEPVSVPEPASLALVVLGMAGVAATRRRRPSNTRSP